MEVPASIPAMQQLLMAYRIEHSASLPDGVRTALANADAGLGGPTLFLSCMEALYGARDELDKAGKTIVAQLGSFCAMHGWPGGDPRPGLIAQAMRRELREKLPAGLSWPKPKDDPAPIELGGVPGVTPPPAPETGA